MDWNTAYMGFINYLKIKKYSPATIDHYGDMIKPFKLFLEEKGITDIRQTGRRELLEYLESVLKEKVSSSTKASRIQVLKRFYEHLMNESHLLINPCEGIRVPVRKKLPRNILTPEEADKILKQPNTSIMVGIRDKAILELLYSTGIRIGECEALSIYDVDTKERLVRIKRGKGAKERVAPMGTNTAKWLKEYQQRVRPRSNRLKSHVRTLFLAKNGNPMSGKMLRAMVQKYVKEAKIKKKGITCHSFRHTFATELVRNGAEITKVQELLGHRDIKSTLIYTRVVPLDVKETHRKTHPRERRKTDKQ